MEKFPNSSKTDSQQNPQKFQRVPQQFQNLSNQNVENFQKKFPNRSKTVSKKFQISGKGI